MVTITGAPEDGKPRAMSFRNTIHDRTDHDELLARLSEDVLLGGNVHDLSFRARHCVG